MARASVFFEVRGGWFGLVGCWGVCSLLPIDPLGTLGRAPTSGLFPHCKGILRCSYALRCRSSFRMTMVDKISCPANRSTMHFGASAYFRSLPTMQENMKALRCRSSFQSTRSGLVCDFDVTGRILVWGLYPRCFGNCGNHPISHQSGR